MTALPERVDLLVVGAGTAGAMAAGHAAARGLRVLCVERGALSRAGAHWRNGVGRDAFEAAGIPVSSGAELHGDDGPFHMLAGQGPERVLVRDHGVVDVDMRRLVERLQARALQAGAHLEGDVELRGVEGPMARTSRGSVRASAIVDASGLAGARLLDQPPTPRRDLCAAAQAIFTVDDPAGAAAFLERYGVGPGETLCFAGVAGGYSILNVRVRHDEIGILTGSIPADGHPSGRRLIDRFVASQPWIGAERSAGQRAIPLGRPHDVLARGRVALLGDAARQVFAAHGSGIGPGLIAARLLADTLADGGSPEDYAVAWMRRHGGLFAGYDAVRRYSQDLPLASLKRLLRAELVDPETTSAGLAQRLPRLSAGRAVALAPGLARVGPLALGLAAVGGRMAALQGLYAAYPRGAGAQRRWSRAVARIARDVA